MWRSWVSSSGGVQTAPASYKNFTCSSFKDIQSLCKEENHCSSNLKRPSIFHRVRVVTSVLRNWSSTQTNPEPNPKPEPAPPQPCVSLTGGDQSVVVYFTSLRVVRKTFEDCSTVRSILRGFRVKVDERDLSMDAGFLDELKGILGRKKLSLPRVFIGGRYVGGAEEIRQLHETGELKKLLGGFPVAAGVCDECGGYRFMLCENCDGSRKVYSEKTGFRICTACNENGLIRCPSCSREHFYKAIVIRKFALKVSFKSTPMGLHPLEFSCIIVFDLARGTEGMRACRKLVGAGETS
uniref:Glutaredoxin domain-containing protein n=1 Tax=Vitis vinifera TaxID=29760 RepID=F6HC84_VITVI